MFSLLWEISSQYIGADDVMDEDYLQCFLDSVGALVDLDIHLYSAEGRPLQAAAGRI